MMLIKLIIICVLRHIRYRLAQKLQHENNEALTKSVSRQKLLSRSRHSGAHCICKKMMIYPKPYNFKIWSFSPMVKAVVGVKIYYCFIIEFILKSCSLSRLMQCTTVFSPKAHYSRSCGFRIMKVYTN